MTKANFQIYLDMDGVISNWCDAVLNALGGNTPEIQQKIINSWSTIDDIYGEDKVIFTVDQLGTKFWSELDVYPWAHELFDRLSEVAPVCFLTNQGRWPSTAVSGKIEWLKKHGFPHRDVIFAEAKWFAASPRHFLVDDKPSNITKFVECSGSAYLWPCAYTLRKTGYADVLNDVVNSAALARDSYLKLAQAV